MMIKTLASLSSLLAVGCVVGDVGTLGDDDSLPPLDGGPDAGTNPTHPRGLPEGANCKPAIIPTSRAQLSDAIDALVCNSYRTHYVPGAVAVRISNGQVAWSQAYGWSNVAAQTPMSTSTVFQVASMSKSVSAWGVLALVDDGHLSLDTPVQSYITRFRLPASQFDARGVTPRRIMGHTAGLNLGGYAGYDPNGPLPTIEQSLAGDNGGSGALQLVAAPGSAWSYSGGGITLLQLAVEEITGKPYADYMRDRVLGPLGMTSSSYAWDPELRPRTATAYDQNGAPVPNYLFVERAAAGLYATAADYAKFVIAHDTGGGVISSARIADMLTPVGGPWNLGFGEPGLGDFDIKLANGDSVLNHTGSNIGWKTLWFYDRTKREGIVVLTNGEAGTEVQNDVASTWTTWMNALP